VKKEKYIVHNRRKLVDF